MIFRKKKEIDPTKPLLDGDQCDGYCPFLVSPVDKEGNFDYSKPYRCSRYNTELRYYDWNWICDECYKENIDERGRG